VHYSFLDLGKGIRTS